MASRKSTGKRAASPLPGPRVRGSSSRGGGARENEEVEDRFVSRDAQNLYRKVLKNEVFIPSMRFEWVELDNSEFSDVFEGITNFGLRNFLGFKAEIYDDAVREFYANLSIIGSDIDTGVSLVSSINGRTISLVEDTVCSIFGLPRGGVRPRASFIDIEILRTEDGDTDEEAEENFGYTEEKGAELLTRLCSEHTPPYEAMDLPLHYRLLHYALNRVIYPKKASSNQITSLDKEILWHLEEGRQINYASLIIQMMRKKASLLRGELKGTQVRHKGMPYAALITAMAKHHECDLSRYAHSPYPPNWRFTPYNLRSMKLVRTVEQGWVYFDHVAKRGLTLEDDQVPQRQRSKRAADRPSSSGPSNVRRPEVTQEDLHGIREEINDLNDRVDGIQTVITAMAKKIDKQHRMLKRIFSKLGCRHDDASP